MPEIQLSKIDNKNELETKDKYSLYIIDATIIGLTIKVMRNELKSDENAVSLNPNMVTNFGYWGTRLKLMQTNEVLGENFLIL